MTLYELALGLARSSHLNEDTSHSRVIPQKASIGLDCIVVKDEGTVQQTSRDVEIRNTSLEFNLPAAIKKEALGRHDFI